MNASNPTAESPAALRSGPLAGASRRRGFAGRLVGRRALERLGAALALGLGCALVVGCAGGRRPTPAPDAPAPHPLSATSPDARAHYLEAFRLSGLLERTSAIREIHLALEADSSFTMAWRLLATSLWADGDTAGGDAAIAAAIRWAEGATETERLHVEAADAGHRRQWERSLSASDRILRLTPDDPMAHSNRGIALRNLGRYDEALAAYDRALALVPDSRLVRTNRATVLSRLGRHTEAMQDLELGSFGQILDRYRAQPGPKALAFARDSLGRWTSWRASAGTRTQAVARAVLSCSERVAERGLLASCAPYAIDDDVVEGAPTPGLRAPDVGGRWVLEVAADPSCTELPIEARSRVYTAVVTQAGASLRVALDDAPLVNDPGLGNRREFSGAIFADGVAFDLSGGVAERISSTNYVLVEGLGLGTATEDEMTGSLAGSVTWGGYPSEVCSHEGHTFTFMRM